MSSPSNPRRRIGEASSSRQRSSDGVWQEPFVEAVAVRVAADANRDHGRLAAARAVGVLFQVCSSWRQITYSEPLWQTLTRQIWSVDVCRLPSWREEFISHHTTARNFRTGNFSYTCINTHDPTVPCRRLALSEHHLAAGFSDGSVRLFNLPTGFQFASYSPYPGRALLGPFSHSISGLLLENDIVERLVFASQDGDIQVASTQDPDQRSHRVRVGNNIVDGVLVDFAGCHRRWVGLFAGVPGRSIQVWDSTTGTVLFVGGNLTDPDSVTGWQMLTDLTLTVGRILVPDPTTAFLTACTSITIQTVDLNPDGPMGVTLEQQDFAREVLVETFDACEGRVLVVDARGVARVRRARTLEEVRRFRVGRGARLAAGCVNWGFAVLCSADEVTVWDVVEGEYLYELRGRGDEEGVVVGGVVTASERNVVAWSSETGLLHLWDFGAL